ncbi:hypothetical protein [Pseudomonas sp. 2(2015)]|uniref:hypothetical protein n=1 Tax=Pseudomonas sp. 2(2015) TaxID=1619950 RepID=UPI0005EBEA9D|nr:hypothetical protein [Pseudomonas sp. 2(2015)]KJK16639.1 hypothetical protein UB48_15590 [Pseudomonas sp. 2(2015)]
MSNSFIATLYGKIDDNKLSRVPVTLNRFDEVETSTPGKNFAMQAGYSLIDQDWLTLNPRDPQPVELIFEYQTSNNKYKIKVNTGTYKDRTMSISKSGYVGAYNNPGGDYVFFELQLNGQRVLGESLGTTTERIKILNNNGGALQMFKGHHYEYPNQWNYITDCDGWAQIEFYLTITKRI